VAISEQQSVAVVPPLPRDVQPGLLAPPAQIDRFPTVIGANLTGQYLSSVYRLCTQGWRYGFVDLINELFEHDPHARGVFRQRVLALAGARVEINAARLPANHPDEKLAGEIAEQFDFEFTAIPCLSQSLGQLAWACVYGVTGQEIQWDLTDQWEMGGLSQIHSRRLNYSNPTSWDLYVYDQGLVGPGYFMGETTGVRGLRVADYPGKFIIHTPALNADYATRDGEGRYVGTYMLLKRMIVRATAQDFERTIRPWLVGYFNRKLENGATERTVAQPEDIADLKAAVQLFASGSFNGVSLPDSVKLELLRAASSMNAAEFLGFLNREISKAALGQSFTTEPGANGNYGTAEIAKSGTLEILRYEAGCMSDTIQRDMATPWMALRYPQASRKLLPRIKLHVDELPDPKTVMEVAAKGASIDMPIDVDALAEQTGLKLVAENDKEGRRTRMVAAGKAESPAPDPESDSTLERPKPKDDAEEPEEKEEKPNGRTQRAPAEA
jgi:uncharacterized protein DUF935